MLNCCTPGVERMMLEMSFSSRPPLLRRDFPLLDCSAANLKSLLDFDPSFSSTSSTTGTIRNTTSALAWKSRRKELTTYNLLHHCTGYRRHQRGLHSVYHLLGRDFPPMPPLLPCQTCSTPWVWAFCEKMMASLRNPQRTEAAEVAATNGEEQSAFSSLCRQCQWSSRTREFRCGTNFHMLNRFNKA